MARTASEIPTLAHSTTTSTPVAAAQPFAVPTSQSNRPSTASPTHRSSNVGHKLSDSSSIKRQLAPRIELTGAAAVADNARHQQDLHRQSAPGTSANPAHTGHLFEGASQPMSRPVDALPAPSMSQPPDSGHGKSNGDSSTQPRPPIIDAVADTASDGQPATLHHSPQALQSNVFATPNNSHEHNALGQSTSGQSAEGTTSRKRPLSPSSSQEPSPSYSTYPPLSTAITNAQGSRNASLPNVGGKSGTGKKHRCPHCSTEFTRHHNLKSHLLTHSQEKPYGCSQCDARFRRLHDLKRHLKLHTGERPHVCDVCGRAFARGDALARHNKGPGGCAGRRESGVDEDDLDGLDEVEMEEERSHGSKEGSRRKSEPNKRSKRGSTRLSTGGGRQSTHGSSYPPVAPLTGSTQAYYPQISGPSSTSSSTRFNHVQYHPAPSMYAHGSMTESPKPLSPGQVDTRHRGPDGATGRSPSISTRMQRQNMLRSNTGTGTPPAGMPANSMQGGHQPLPSIQAADSRFLPPSGTRLPPPILSTQGAQPGHMSGLASAGPASASSHHHSSGGSMREVWGGGPQAAPPADQRLLDYMRDMSEQMRVMQEERGRERQDIERFREDMDQLRSENDTLRQQLHHFQSPSHAQIQQQQQHQHHHNQQQQQQQQQQPMAPPAQQGRT